jgi:hypothetical protein
MASEDGETWGDWLDMGVPVCPNFGPSATRSGRLIIPGNVAFPYTDDPSGLSGWTMAGIYPPEMADTTDDPDSFWVVAERAGWPTAVCEASLMQTDDGVLLLSKGASVLHINGQAIAIPQASEYSRLYAHFAGLIGERLSDTDTAPLTLVADAFLCGRRIEVEAFSE